MSNSKNNLEIGVNLMYAIFAICLACVLTASARVEVAANVAEKAKFESVTPEHPMKETK